MLPLRLHTRALSQTHRKRRPAAAPARRPVEPRAPLTLLQLVMLRKYRRGRADRWMRWTGGSTPQRRGRRGRPCGLLGANEKGALSLEGFLPLSRFRCGDGRLSLAARYQSAFWESVPHGPPRSGLCLSLSRHKFFYPSFVLIPALGSLPAVVTLRFASRPKTNELLASSQRLSHTIAAFLSGNYIWLSFI